MNDRIKELAKQAGDYVNEVYTEPVRSKISGKIWEDGHIDWHTQFNQKFAELIVVECAMFVVTELEGKVGSAIADATANRLEEHFGVEE